MKMAWTIVLALLLAGCSSGERAAKAKPLTEAQRDSAIARSSLPGASVVGGALKASGQAAGHAAQLDSLTR